MKKRVIAGVAASAVTLCTAVTIAVGGTAGDPMLSKSYIDGAYTVQTISKAEEKITLRHDTLYQSAEETLKAKNDDYLTRGGLVTGDGTYQAAFSDLRVKEGDTVRIETGSGFGPYLPPLPVDQRMIRSESRRAPDSCSWREMWS